MQPDLQRRARDRESLRRGPRLRKGPRLEGRVTIQTKQLHETPSLGGRFFFV